MLEIKMVFPVKADAHNANYRVNKFFQGSEMFINNNIIVTPVKHEPKSGKFQESWYFYIDICQDSLDTQVEKSIEIVGGLLNLVDKGKDVWAFSF